MSLPELTALGLVAAVHVVSDGVAPPRTLVELRVVETVRSEAGTLERAPVLRFGLPGDNGAGRGSAVGVPVVRAGESWRVDLVWGRSGWTPRGLGAGMERLGPAPASYTLSGLQYDDTLLPRTFFIQGSGSAALGLSATEDQVRGALDAWNGVRCSTFRFDYGGVSGAEVVQDGINLLSWMDSAWDWDPAVAGYTLHYYDFHDDGTVTVAEADVVFNGVDWTLTEGPGDAYSDPPLVHAGSVITHELGHVTGLGHVEDHPTTTMFYAYVGGDWLATLAGDDRAGLCANYPSGIEECTTNEDCADIDGSQRVCAEFDGMGVCDEVRDPVGSFCSRTWINCEQYCAFTNGLATEGFCTVGCDGDGDCPDGYVCDDFSRKLPQDDNRVCRPDESASDDDSAGDDDDTTPAHDDDTTAGESPDGAGPEGCACTQADPDRGAGRWEWGAAVLGLVLVRRRPW